MYSCMSFVILAYIDGKLFFLSFVEEIRMLATPLFLSSLCCSRRPILSFSSDIWVGLCLTSTRAETCKQLAALTCG